MLLAPFTRPRHTLFNAVKIVEKYYDTAELCPKECLATDRAKNRTSTRRRDTNPTCWGTTRNSLMLPTVLNVPAAPIADSGGPSRRPLVIIAEPEGLDLNACRGAATAHAFGHGGAQQRACVGVESVRRAAPLAVCMGRGGVRRSTHQSFEGGWSLPLSRTEKVSEMPWSLFIAPASHSRVGWRARPPRCRDYIYSPAQHHMLTCRSTTPRRLYRGDESSLASSRYRLRVGEEDLTSGPRHHGMMRMKGPRRDQVRAARLAGWPRICTFPQIFDLPSLGAHDFFIISPLQACARIGPNHLLSAPFI